MNVRRQKRNRAFWKGTLVVLGGLSVAALWWAGGAVAQNGRKVPGRIAADAGKDLENAGFNARVTLDGSRSRPSKDGGALRFAWRQVSGTPVTLVGADTATPTFTTPPANAHLDSYWYVEGPGIPGTPGVVNRARRGLDLTRWRVIPFGRQQKVLEFEMTVTDGNSFAGVGQASDRVTVYLDSKYGLGVATGLRNVAVGTRVYLGGATSEATGTNWAAGTVADPKTHQPGTNDRITGWEWTLSAKPNGSQAVLAGETTQTPSLVPDVPGEYRIDYQITSVGDIPADFLDRDGDGRHGGDGEVTDPPGSLTFVAAKWVGVGTVGGEAPRFAPQCGVCHQREIVSSKGEVLQATVPLWEQTGHATVLQRGLNGLLGNAFQESCMGCHAVGFDKSPSANNGGWDDLAGKFRYKRPAPGLFDRMQVRFPELAQRAGVQCENCHGPGSLHGGDPKGISHSQDARICAPCHDTGPSPAFLQWRNHRHGYDVHIFTQKVSTLTGFQPCQRCHSSEGWVQMVAKGGEPIDLSSPSRVGCPTCHDPHNAEKEHQLRIAGPGDMIELPDGSRVEGGKGTVCMTCHNMAIGNENGVVERGILKPAGVRGYIEAYVAGEKTIPGTDIPLSDTFIFPQRMPTNAEMLVGTGGYEFPGERYARSFHFENPDTCVTCHMFETPAAGEEGHNRVGGHTFNVRSPEEFTGIQHGKEAGEEVTNMAACQQCHPGLQELNRRARGDHDGDGRVEGVQDEVRDLLALVKAAPGYSATIKRTSTLEQAAARWNVAFVEMEGSMGIHNTAYAVTLLQRSYKKLTGNEVPGADIVSKRDDFAAKRSVLRLK